MACLLSLAQMRSGGAVTIFSVRETKVWMLSADIPISYLNALQSAFPQRCNKKLVVTLHGPWDMIKDEGRE